MGNVGNIEGSDLELGCNTRSLPTTYMRLTLGVCHNSANIWNGMEKDFEKTSFMEETYFERRKS